MVNIMYGADPAGPPEVENVPDTVWSGLVEVTDQVETNFQSYNDDVAQQNGTHNATVSDCDVIKPVNQPSVNQISLMKRICNVKKKYIPAKLTYFLFFAGQSLIWTYFTIFLVSLGLDPNQAGLIQVARNGIMILSGLFWGWLAHKTNKNLLIICIKIVFSTTLINLMPYAGRSMMTKETASKHQEHLLAFINSTNNATSWIDHGPQNHTHYDKNSGASVTHSHSYFEFNWEPSHYTSASPYLFLTMLGVSIASIFFEGGALMIIEARVYNMIKSTSKGQSTYGRQRLCGSISTAITPLIAGTLMESIENNGTNSLQIVFYMHMGIMLAALVTCIFLFRQDNFDGKTSTTSSTSSEQTDDIYVSTETQLTVTQILRNTFYDFHNQILFGNILLWGFAFGLQWYFQFVFMQEIGSTKVTMGLCVTIQYAVEAMVYPFAMKIVNSLGKNVITALTFFSYMALFFVLCILKSTILAVVPAVLLGFFNTLYHNASMDNLHTIGGVRFMTILQALYHIIFTGIGNSLSGLLGGIIYKWYGGRVLFFCSGVLMLITGLMNILYAKCFKQEKNRSVIMENSPSSNIDDDLGMKTEMSELTEEIDSSETTSDEGIYLSMDEYDVEYVVGEDSTGIS